MTNRQQDAIKLLLTIQGLGDGLTWSTQTVSDLLKWPPSRADGVVRWSVNKGYLSIGRGIYGVTVEGREFVGMSIAQARVRASMTEFRDEVLTGITKTGKRSLIDRAVLPTAPPHKDRSKCPEWAVMRAQLEDKAHRKEAKRLGLTVKEYHRGLKSGEVHLCKGIDGPHVGRFHRHGDRWQDLCIECRKKQRKR